LVNIVLGAWLFISTFIWPHAGSSATNTWVVGLLIVIVAIIAMYWPVVRWLNTLLGAWLFISAFVISNIFLATTWNNAIVAILVFLISLMPGGLYPTARHGAGFA
jgi:hypothetical protein